MPKRIILVGPSGAGKDYIRNKFREKGYSIDVSYTTRLPREGEKPGVDYKFMSSEDFELGIESGLFYEFAQHGDFYYGTGLHEWENCEVFIMESEGVKSIRPEDRSNCLIIYVNTSLTIRLTRLILRGWDNKKIAERMKLDEEKFRNFTDYDLEISSE